MFEEDFDFTVKFVDMAEGVTLIIPHLGLLGGNPYDFLKAFKDNESIYFDTALASRDQIKKFVETIGLSVLFLDLTCRLGLCIANSIKFFPYRFLTKTRKCFFIKTL